MNTIIKSKSLPFLSLILVYSIISTKCTAQKSQGQEIDPWVEVKNLKAQIHAPTFPDHTFLISEYGAVGDGKTNNTKAFQKAIKACSIKGGGRVVVPKGVYLTGAIHLKDKVNLHLRKGAKILFSRNTSDYLPIVFTRFAGIELMNYSPFIYAYKKSNIAITGHGILDGNANDKYWWPWKGLKDYGWNKGEPNHKDDWDLLSKMNKKQVPVKNRTFGEGHYLRPVFIQTYKSKNILIKGVIIQNSPFWDIHPVLSENVIIEGVHTNSLGPNNDGINPESSKNVWIKNCYFNTGDDCIAIKSGRNQDGRRINKPSKNIIIENSHFKEGHGGIVIGSEITGGAENVYARNLAMNGSDLKRVLRIKSNSKRGGIIQNIYLKDIKVGIYKDAAIKINMFYGRGLRGNKFYRTTGQFMPTIKNIKVENLKVKNGGKYGIFIKTYERSPVRNFRVINTMIDNVEIPLQINYAKNLKLEHVMMNGKMYKQ